MYIVRAQYRSRDAKCRGGRAIFAMCGKFNDTSTLFGPMEPEVRDQTSPVGTGDVQLSS